MFFEDAPVAMDFMDFGRRNDGCHLMSEGFVLWKVDGKDPSPVLLEGRGRFLIVHIVTLEGGMKISCGGGLYPLTKGCYANFIDITSFEVSGLSKDLRAYVLIFESRFITSLLKNNPPFPPSYVLKLKAWPVFVMSSERMSVLERRSESLEEFFEDGSHHFQTEMLKCSLLMFMMDAANEYIRQENERGERVETGCKSILFKQFVKLMLARIKDEHSVGWYASQLCVTPQYLNRVVKNASKKTVYEHICTTLTGAIIEQLENTDTPVSRIAEDFHFPDLATMTKFFKRHTGQTPTEYRKTATL